MFLEAAGPTALRENLVYGLSLSQGDVQIEPDGPLARAGIAAVWNGARGLVVVVVRTLDPPAVRRFEWDGPLERPAALEQVLDEAAQFAGTFGFAMDPCEFGSLGARERERRLYQWNTIRKVRTPTGAKPPLQSSEDPAVPAAVARPANLQDEDPAEASTASFPMGLGVEAEEPQNPAKPRRAVLGRMQLKQHRRPDARARVLSQF